MHTTIDKSGRLVLPKEARDRLGIKPGDVLNIEATAEGLHLTVVPETPRLVKDGNVLVFAGGVLERGGIDAVEEHRQSRVAELVRQAMS